MEDRVHGRCEGGEEMREHEKELPGNHLDLVDIDPHSPVTSLK